MTFFYCTSIFLPLTLSDGILRKAREVVHGLANPLDVVDYLYGDTDPPVLTETMREEIKVGDNRFDVRGV